MTCLSSTRIAEIRAEIVVLDASIAAAQIAYDSALTNSEIASYRFDPGAGSQRADRRAPKEIRQEIESLKATRARLTAQLTGGANVTMRLRRGRY